MPYTQVSLGACGTLWPRLSSIPELELRLAKFLSSITITVIAISTHSSTDLSSISPLWRGFLLLGAFVMVLSNPAVKQTVLLRGTDSFDLRKASVVWTSSCALPLMCSSPLTLVISLSFSSSRRGGYLLRGPLTAHGCSFYRSCIFNFAAAELALEISPELRSLFHT
jgi:hypothetical protein